MDLLRQRGRGNVLRIEIAEKQSLGRPRRRRGRVVILHLPLGGELLVVAHDRRPVAATEGAAVRGDGDIHLGSHQAHYFVSFFEEEDAGKAIGGYLTAVDLVLAK